MKHEVLSGDTEVQSVENHLSVFLSGEAVFHLIGPLRFQRENKQKLKIFEHLNLMFGSSLIVYFSA